MTGSDAFNFHAHFPALLMHDFYLHRNMHTPPSSGFDNAADRPPSAAARLRFHSPRSRVIKTEQKDRRRTSTIVRPLNRIGCGPSSTTSFFYPNPAPSDTSRARVSFLIRPKTIIFKWSLLKNSQLDSSFFPFRSNVVNSVYLIVLLNARLWRFINSKHFSMNCANTALNGRNKARNENKIQ